jgi:hypothetical protein
MGDHTIPARQWTRPEYDRLIEIGFFREDDKVELMRLRERTSTR